MSPDAYGNLAARLRAAAGTASPELQDDLILAADEIGGMMYAQSVASRAIDEAVAAEREACAKIADDYAEQARDESWLVPSTACRSASAVADMIRSRK